MSQAKVDPVLEILNTGERTEQHPGHEGVAHADSVDNKQNDFANLFGEDRLFIITGWTRRRRRRVQSAEMIG